ncbi:hypothetical protein [Persephonella sp.]
MRLILGKYTTADIVVLLKSKKSRVLYIVAGIAAAGLLLLGIKGLIYDTMMISQEIENTKRQLLTERKDLAKYKSVQPLPLVDYPETLIRLKTLEYRYGLIPITKRVIERKNTIKGQVFRVFQVSASYSYEDYEIFKEFLKRLQEGWYNLRQVRTTGRYVEVQYEAYTK